MDRFSLAADEDQDSLFGSPPPSPARGRSPSQETFIAGEEFGDAAPSTGVGGKNVGTIALPGSHMSCAELPADLPAASSSFPRPTSGHDSSCTPSVAGTPISVHASVAASRSSTRSGPSRASSAASMIPSACTSTRKRRTSKAKSLTPAPPAPPITLPGPNEPTPPNFLRSQSSLLGLAGLVGCVKPARLYANGPQPPPVRQPRSHSPARGSTPTHPIVLDDDQDTLRTGKHPCGQHQIPRRLDELNPETLRSNIVNSLVKEKNIFPVLESLIKLLGGEPHPPSANPPSEPFARPYGHGIFNAQNPSPVTPLPVSGGFTNSPAAPPLKRRKLKHVPAGAADWDVPFPFATGEGPKAYRDTWAQDRVKQLVTQLLDLVQNATKRAAIKTAKGGGEDSRGRPRAQTRLLSRSVSVEAQNAQIGSTQASPSPEIAMAETPDNATLMSSLGHYLNSLESPNTTSGCSDSMSVDPQDTAEGAGCAVPCDNSAFEEWLSQLQQFMPLEANAPTPESDLGARLSVPLDSSASSPAQNIHIPMEHDASIAPHMVRDESIDPALLAISQQCGSVRQSHSPILPTPILAPGDISQAQDVSSTPPVLAHSPRTSLSSLTEPLTPLSEVFSDAPASGITLQDLGRDPAAHLFVEKDPLRPSSWAQAQGLSLIDPSELTRISAAQKGKARADINAPPAPSMPDRVTVSAVSTLKGALDKQAILERARERRRQLVEQIEQTRTEVWATSIENAVLVQLTRNGMS